jgi:hypothetical protein
LDARRTAAFDEPAGRVDLIRAVDGQVETVERIEVLERKTKLPGGPLGSGRRGDAAQVQIARCEDGKEVRNRGARPQSEGHAVLDELGRLFRRGPFLVLDCAQERISSQLMPRASSQ